MIDNFEGLGNLIVRFLPEDILSLQLRVLLSLELSPFFESRVFFVRQNLRSLSSCVAAAK